MKQPAHTHTKKQITININYLYYSLFMSVRLYLKVEGFYASLTP